MKISHDLYDELHSKFVAKQGANTIGGSLLPKSGEQVDLGSSDRTFRSLYVENLYAGSVTSVGGNIDKVDGFHASATPAPNMLLTLNASGVFPDSVFPNALLKTGGNLTGNVTANAGVTLDGIDVSKLGQDVYSHIATGHHAEVHNLTGSDHTVSGLTVGQVLRATGANSFGFGAILDGDIPQILVRTSRSVLAGMGLTGGGSLATDINLGVKLSNDSALTLDAYSGLTLKLPGDLGVGVEASARLTHTHKINSSSAPGEGESVILQSDVNGGLSLQRLSLGGAPVTEKGVLGALTADIANDVNIGGTLRSSGVLNVLPSGAVQINPGAAVKQPGALFVQPFLGSTVPALVARAGASADDAVLVQKSDGNLAMRIRSNGTLESGATYVRGNSGWQITPDGDAEFRNLVARGEMHTAVFSQDEIHVSGGTLMVMPSGKVSADPAYNLLVADGSTMNILVSASEVSGAAPFSMGDVLRVKFLAKTHE